jgi:hypothetical protein
MSESGDEGFTIHKASVAIVIPRPEYKPIKIMRDQSKIQEKEKKIQKVIQLCSEKYDNTYSAGFCCKKKHKILVYKDDTAISDNIKDQFKDLLGFLSFLDTDTSGCNLFTIAVLSSLFQEAKKEEFENYYKKNKLSVQITDVNGKINSCIEMVKNYTFSKILETIISELKKTVKQN